jgi:3-deoxy-D-manno-octulosonic acid kinase
VPTVEVLGARVEWTARVLYRGLLITRQAVGFHNLWDWLQTPSAVDLRRSILGAVAQTIATMHRAGIAHADLNPTNILVCSDYDPPQALLIDFDRARRFPGPVPAYLRESNLRRFRRFFNKNDILGEWLTPTEFEYFRQAYEVALPLKR